MQQNIARQHTGWLAFFLFVEVFFFFLRINNIQVCLTWVIKWNLTAMRNFGNAPINNINVLFYTSQFNFWWKRERHLIVRKGKVDRRHFFFTGGHSLCKNKTKKARAKSKKKAKGFSKEFAFFWAFDQKKGKGIFGPQAHLWRICRRILAHQIAPAYKRQDAPLFFFKCPLF